MKPVKRKVYVEGGGYSALDTQLRKAFSQLFRADGIARPPAVVACGSRSAAYDRFCIALDDPSQQAWLLVDAEALPAQHPPSEDPWAHVLGRPGDQWARPAGATDAQLHFMCVTMESWLLADGEALKAELRKRYVARRLPAPKTIETLTKAKINTLMKAVSSGSYDKGSHSFKILARVRPTALRQLSWAERFLDAVG